jgi:hypothetical protein
MLQGKGDPPAAAAGAGARLRLLGILRLRAGHGESHRRRFRPAAFSRRESGFGRFYFGFVAVWAVRWRFPSPAWPCAASWCGPNGWAKVSPESGVIAALIFALMVTYLAGLWFGRRHGGRARTGGCTPRRCWRFLPLIPHTKHLHLALSPVTVFLRRAGFSRIPPLSGDEDFGLDTGKDVTASTRCRPSPAWSAAAAPSIVRRTTPARCSTPKKSSWGCAAT